MGAQEQRSYLKTLYGQEWKAKVDKMSDAQVIAVHARIQSKERQRKISSKENSR